MGETKGGVVLMPTMEAFVEVASSRSEDEERGATRVEARRITVPMRDHLDLEGVVMVGKGGEECRGNRGQGKHVAISSALPMPRCNLLAGYVK